MIEPVVTARMLVVAAHPDDETIGAGALLAKSIDAHVAVVTDGTPWDRSLWAMSARATTREEYARTRRDELHLALADAGVSVDRVHALDVPDGEATDSIPLIVTRLIRLLADINPDIVVTHAYEGGHVDHDATALAVHAAMAMSGRGHPHEMALYHGADGAIAVHEFLPGGPPSRTVHLDERLRARKTKMLERFESQRQYEAYFETHIERYRCAPRYDFRESPHPARPLLYERSTAASGERWRELARLAIEQLKRMGWREDRQPHDGEEGLQLRPHVAAMNQGDAREPLVSVIVRTTGRDTLVQALDSMACQTHRNLEILVVDANGQGLPASIRDREDLTVRARAGIRLDRPQAANVGLDAATGKYIAFLDDDDWFHPDHIALLVRTLESASDARVAYSGVEVVEWSAVSPVRRHVYDSPYDPIGLLCANYIPLNAVLFERGLLDHTSRFDETLPLYEDWDFLIGLSRRTRFAKAAGITAVYRWPPGSGVNEPARTAATQKRVFEKWRGALSAEEHIALMRRAELNDDRRGAQPELQAHLNMQDEELARLRPQVGIQERQLKELRTHLRGQDAELARLRPHVSSQGRQLEALRPHLRAQDEELARLRPQVRSQEQQLEELRTHLRGQDEELARLRPHVASQERQLEELRTHLLGRDEELARLRPQVRSQEQQLEALRTHLRGQDEELARLRPCVGSQEQQLEELRAHLKGQDDELARLRPWVGEQETQLQALRTDREQQDQELDRLRRVGEPLQLELNHARDQLRAQDEELSILRARVITQSDDMRRLNEARAVSDERLAAILSSRSWKLTRPLRALRALVVSFAPRGAARSSPKDRG